VDAAAAARQALADTRAGGFFYAHLAGVRGFVPEAGRAEVTVRDDGSAAMMPLATVADVALGTALRSRLTPGRLLVTTMLTLSLTRRPRGLLTAVGHAVHLAPGSGVATCLLDDDTGRCGVATGSFLAPAGGSGYAVTPWEHDAPPPPRPVEHLGEPTAAEAAALQDVVAAAQRARESGTALSDELLALSDSEVSGDACVVACRAGAALANRAGTVHGGALTALAVAAARPLLDDAAWEAREVSVHFVRPGALEPGGELTARSRLRRRGGRSAVTDVTVAGADGTVALALLRFGRAPES
jgi:acyl-coenzyme A thioesterase PaaI-like protein